MNFLRQALFLTSGPVKYPCPTYQPSWLSLLQVQSKEEEEQVNQLEFKARQRLTALEADTRQAAMLQQMRDEVRDG